MTVAGFGLGWVGIKAQQARRQHAAVQAIEKSGGEVLYDYQLGPDDYELQTAQPPGPTWLRSLVGNDMFDDVVKVSIRADEQMEFVKALPHLTSLEFYCSDQVSDAGLAYLRDVPQLRSLGFGISGHVTDAGLVHLSSLTQLRQLDMRYLDITDAGLEHVKGLNQLEELTLGNAITNTGLEQLKGLTQLKELHVWATQVTDEGVLKLQEELPNCKIQMWSN